MPEAADSEWTATAGNWTIQLRPTEEPAGWEVVTTNPAPGARGVAEARQGHYPTRPEAEAAFRGVVQQYREHAQHAHTEATGGRGPADGN